MSEQIDRLVLADEDRIKNYEKLNKYFEADMEKLVEDIGNVLGTINRSIDRYDTFDENYSVRFLHEAKNKLRILYRFVENELDYRNQ